MFSRSTGLLAWGFTQGGILRRLAAFGVRWLGLDVGWFDLGGSVLAVEMFLPFSMWGLGGRVSLPADRSPFVDALQLTL